MDLREIRWGGMDWIDVAQDRDQWGALVNTVMNLGVSYNRAYMGCEAWPPALKKEHKLQIISVFHGGDSSHCGLAVVTTCSLVGG
jgi:hypothetical protein